MKTTQQVLERLNERCSVLSGKKLSKSDDLHLSVIGIANEVLDFFKLECSTWYVRLNDKNFNDPLYYENIFQYTDSEIIRDKRVKFGMVGKIGQIIFIPCNENIDTALPLDEYLNEIRKLKVVKGIEKQEAYIQELENGLITANNHLTELKEKLNKYSAILALWLLFPILLFSQINYDKTNFAVASFHAGYSLKYNKPVTGVSFGYRLNNIYASLGTLIAVSSDATVPKIVNSSIGYNIGQFQPFFSYLYQTIGKNAEAYFHGSNDEFSNGFKTGFGLSYYLQSAPICFTVGKYGKDINTGISIYKSF